MITLQELHELNFKVERNYPHDHFITNRLIKGCIRIEKTWDKLQNYKEVSCEVQIDDGEYRDINSLEDLKTLVKIFSKK